MEMIHKVNDMINSVVWGPYMLVLIVGTGILFTFWSKILPVTRFKLWWRGTSGQLFNKVHVSTDAEISPDEKLGKLSTGWIMLLIGVMLALYSIIAIATGASFDVRPLSNSQITNVVLLIISFILCAFAGVRLLMIRFNITAKQRLEPGDNNISPFQAVTTALASTVGTGNIAGVATAIVLGGPGAVFWMWVSGFFGMMTKYAEVVLAVKYREVDGNGTHHGGPMYYIEKGLKMKWLAVIFAIFGTMATFGIGNMTQANAIAGSLEGSFGIPKLATGIVLMVLCALVIVGGIKRIANVAEKLVPFMAVFYIVGCSLIIAMNFDALPGAFSAIFKSAFSFQSAGGGIMGYAIMRAIRYGIARGVFSNEAGLGSAPIAHAASRTKEPVEQGLWGIFEVFVDTLIICTLTAMVILTAGLYQGGSSGAPLVQESFISTFGSFGGIFVSIAILCFAGSTILGWSYYGQQCLGYLTNRNKAVDTAYKLIFSLMVIVGSVGGLTLVWDIADTLNGLMAIPNLIALVLLSNVVMSLTKEYLSRGKSGGKKSIT